MSINQNPKHNANPANQPKLTDAELADLFSYLARLTRLVSPRDAERYYGFTFDSAVTDTLFGLAQLYGGSEGPSMGSIENFKADEFYGPMLERIFADINKILNGPINPVFVD